MLVARLMEQAGDGDGGNSGGDGGAGGGDAGAIPNSVVKAHPLFQKLAAEMAGFRKAEAERKAAEATAQAEAERKALADAGRYEEALAKRDADLAAIKAQHESELKRRDLAMALHVAGFTNDKFIKGAIADYSADSGEIAEYVQTLASAEENRPFLAAVTGDLKIDQVGKPPINGGSKTNWDQVRAWQKSADKAERLKAVDAISDYYDTHGTLPPGFE